MLKLKTILFCSVAILRKVKFRKEVYILTRVKNFHLWKIFFENCILTTESPNNCCILKDASIILISNFATSISGNVYIIGKKFSNKKCVYKSPLPSSLFNCFRVSHLLEFEAWPISDIDKKIMLFPDRKYYAAIPLLHCEISYVYINVFL